MYSTVKSFKADSIAINRREIAWLNVPIAGMRENSGF